MYILFLIPSVINVGLSFMYISASDLRLSQINTRWSVTSLVLTHCLRDYVNVFFHDLSLTCAVYVVSTSASDRLERPAAPNDLVLQFVDDDVKADSLTSPTVQSLY